MNFHKNKSFVFKFQKVESIYKRLSKCVFYKTIVSEQNL